MVPLADMMRPLWERGRWLTCVRSSRGGRGRGEKGGRGDREEMKEEEMGDVNT